MLENLPEVQMQHSIHQPPLGAGDPTQPYSHPLVALCLWQPVSPCVLSFFLPLNPFASRIREGGLQNIVNMPMLKPREVVALRPGVLRLGFNHNNSNFQKEGDQNCSAGK